MRFGKPRILYEVDSKTEPQDFTNGEMPELRLSAAAKENLSEVKQKLKTALDLPDAEFLLPEEVLTYKRVKGTSQKQLLAKAPVKHSTKDFSKFAKPKPALKNAEVAEITSIFGGEFVTKKRLFSELSEEERLQMTHSTLRRLKAEEEQTWEAFRTCSIPAKNNASYDRKKLPLRPHLKIVKSCSNCDYLMRPNCIKDKKGFCTKDSPKMQRPAAFGIPVDRIDKLGWRDTLLYANTYNWYPVSLSMVCDYWDASTGRSQELLYAESATGRKFNRDGTEDVINTPDYSKRLKRSRIDYCFKVCGLEFEVGDDDQPRTLADLVKQKRNRIRPAAEPEEE